MNWFNQRKSFTSVMLCVGIFSLFSGHLFAQRLPEIQNQVQVDYKDIFNGTYSTKSNIVTTEIVGTTAIDLWVSKEGPTEVSPGGIATYTITYGNKGSATAYEVRLCDQFPAEMKEIIYQGAGYTLLFDWLTKQGRWNVGVLPPGTYSFKMSLRIKEDTPGSSSIINAINIESPVPELYWQNNYASSTTQVKSLDIDLWVIKEGPAEILTGGIATYTITYGNSGGTSSMNVVLVDQFPEQMQTIIDENSGVSFEYGSLTKRGTWSITTLLPGTYSFKLAIKIKDDTRGSTTMINTMKIGYPGVETNESNNQSTAITHITNADMEISKYGPSVILSGQNITYTIYYRNRGKTEAENVTLSDYLPAGLQYATDTSGYTPIITGSGTISQPQIVKWDIGTVSPSYDYHQFQITTSVSKELPASPSLSSQINNRVKVTTTSPETDYSNNQATWTTTINAGWADVSIYKYATSKAIRGQEITYAISWANYGNVPAGSVTISDYLPEGLEYRNVAGIGTPTISGSVSSGGQVLTWQVGTMAVGDRKQFQMTAVVSEQIPASKTIHNVVEITTLTKEQNPTNNRATVTSQVEDSKIDLWVRKYGPAKINPGDNTIEYSISYGNYGNVEVGSVTIIDILSSPATTGSVVYGTDTSGLTATQTGNQITWFVGTLTPQSYKYFTLRLIVNHIPGSTTLTNTIQIYPTDRDTNSSNNSYSINTDVEYPKIDLEIVKRGPDKVLPGDDIIYTIQYRNLGSVDVGTTTITDTLPLGVSYTSDTSGFTRRIIGTPTQIIWELGTRAMTGARKWIIFQMTGKVDANLPASTILANRVEISTADTETNYYNNVSTWTTHVIPAKADINITKYKVSPYEVTPGSEIKYRIAYSNYGYVDATNTVIIDTLPGSVTFVSCSGNGTLTSGQVRWNIGTLTKGTYGSVFLTVRVDNNLSGTLTNTVKITSDTPDLDYSNQHATCTLKVADCYADVSISKYGPSSIQAGKRLRYKINYSNYYGNIAATGTMIIDRLPVGISYVTDTSGLSLITEGGTLTWQVGTLAPKYSGYFYLDVNISQDVKPSTTLTNEIEIKTDTYEKNRTNNQASWKTHILPDDVDLGITKYGPEETAQGQEFEYRITVSNYSETSAENVIINDILPQELIYLSSNLPPLVGTGNHIIWQIGTLSGWSSKHLTLQVKVKDSVSASSTITNVVQVTTANPETDYSNNKATVSTHISLAKPQLKVRQWQHYGEVTAGQRMEYYIRYANEGNAEAGNVTLTDILPEGVEYVSDTSGFIPQMMDNKIIWHMGTISSNKSAHFKLQVMVDKYIPASTTLTNLIEITTSDYASNDRYTCTTHIKEPITDVLIYKFGPDEVLYGTEFTYEITYNNNSISDADGVVITDILDPRLTYLTDTSGREPTISGNRISWNMGTMSPWAAGHFLLKVFVPPTVPASTTLTNIIEITTLTDENNYHNNRATVTTHVERPKVDVGIEKKGDDARPGFRKAYHITYYNKGTEQAEDVRIIDKLPPQVQYLSSSGGNYNSASHTVSWNIGSLPPQTEKYLTIEVRIPPTQACGINLYNYIEIITASPESDYTNNKFTEIETVVTSIDPNDKLVSPQKYIRDNELLDYTIRFENQATATVSAILITIEDQLPPYLDWTTMKFGQIKIGTKSYTLENFDRGSLSCSYDVGSGTIRWGFDFKTDEQGLPPNVIPPEGEGYVSFSINTKAGLAAGTEISNTATVSFDYNPPRETPAVTNIVDLNKPTSRVLSLAPYQTATSFAVYWSGTDTAGNKPGEIENYTIYVSDNNGTWTKWLEETVATAATFTGQTGHSYQFYCLAKDRAKNTEEKTPTPEASTSLTIPKHFVIATLTTTEMCVGGTLSLTISIYDSEGNLVTDYVGTATLQDKLGSLGQVVFNGTHTWRGEVAMPQIPNGGTNNISVEAEGVIGAVSDTFLMLLDYNKGGTVTLFTPHLGTTTVRFGTPTLVGGLSQNFYVIIECISPAKVPAGGISSSAREIRVYNRAHEQLSGTLSTLAYLEIPYLDINQDGFVDGTRIKEKTLRVYIWRDNQWQEIVDSGVDETANIVWCQINYLSSFMPIGILVAPSTLGNVVVYPNPFKPNSGLGHEYITFGSKKDITRRLTDYATIKIFNIAGELIKTLEVTPQDNGQKIWYADNDFGHKVASGIYIYLITNPAGEKCIGKLAIIR